MTKLCPRGKAAAKRKFKVYPSAYANAYASKICAGKIKDPSGVKRKDFRGPKPSGAKVGMAVTAGSQSAMGRLEKSGMTKAKKGKMMIMIAVGKPKKAKEGMMAEPSPKGPGKAPKAPIFPKKKKKAVPGNPNERREYLRNLQNPKSEYDKKGKLKYTFANKGKIMQVANKLEKASKAHAGQAKTLKSLKLSRGGGAAIRGTNFKGVF